MGSHGFERVLEGSVCKPHVFIFLVIILLNPRRHSMSSITPPPHFSSPPSLQTRHSSSESTNRNGEEEGKAVKITVWWDIENCPIPTGVDPYQVAKRITSALRFNGINGPITITAYGNMLQFNPVTCDALFTTGVALKYVPNCLFLFHSFFFFIYFFSLYSLMIIQQVGRTALIDLFLLIWSIGLLKTPLLLTSS